MAILGSYIRKVAQEVAAKAGAQLQNFVKPKGSQKWTLCKLNASRNKATLPDGRQVNITFTGSPPAIAPCVQVSGNHYYVMGREDKIQTTDGGTGGILLGKEPGGGGRYWIRRLGEGLSGIGTYTLPLTIQALVDNALALTNERYGDTAGDSTVQLSPSGNDLIFTKVYKRAVYDPLLNNPLVPFDYVLPDDGIACKDPASRGAVNGYCYQCPEKTSGFTANYLEVRWVQLQGLTYTATGIPSIGYTTFLSGGADFDAVGGVFANQPDKPVFNMPDVMRNHFRSTSNQELPPLNCLVLDFPSCYAAYDNLGCVKDTWEVTTLTEFENINDNNSNDFPYAFNYLGNLGYQFSDGCIRVTQHDSGLPRIEVIGSFYLSKFSYTFRQAVEATTQAYVKERCQIRPFFSIFSICRWMGFWEESYTQTATNLYYNFNPGNILYPETNGQGDTSTVAYYSPCNPNFWNANGRQWQLTARMSNYQCDSQLQPDPGICPVDTPNYSCTSLRERCVYHFVGGATSCSPYIPADPYNLISVLPNTAFMNVAGCTGIDEASFGQIWECRDCAQEDFFHPITQYNGPFTQASGPKCFCLCSYGGVYGEGCCATGFSEATCPSNDNMGQCEMSQNQFGAWYLKNTVTVFGGFVFDIDTNTLGFIKSEKLNTQNVNCQTYNITKDNFFYGYDGEHHDEFGVVYGGCPFSAESPEAVYTKTGECTSEHDYCLWTQNTLSNIDQNIDILFKIMFAWRGKSGGTAEIALLRSDTDPLGSFGNGEAHYVFYSPDFTKVATLPQTYQEYPLGPYIFTDTLIYWDAPPEFVAKGTIMGKATDSYKLLSLYRNSNIFSIEEWTYKPETDTLEPGRIVTDTTALPVFDSELIDFVIQ